jgi:hypothetical protein
MANLDEIAHGLVAVLRHSAKPEPLGVDLWNEDAAAAGYLVRAVVDECTAAGVNLFRVRLDQQFLSADLPANHEGVAIEADNNLSQRLEFYREP